jgi:hypothetical protein
MWKYLLAWIPMVLIAIANGALRQAWYGKHLGELQAHQVSTVSGVLLFGAYIWLTFRTQLPEWRVFLEPHRTSAHPALGCAVKMSGFRPRASSHWSWTRLKGLLSLR